MSKVEGLVSIEKLKLCNLRTVKSFLAWLLDEKGIVTTKQAIHYQLENADNIDWCEWCGLKLIIFNDKSKSYTPKESNRS